MNYKVRKAFAIFILTLLILVATTSYYGIRGIDNLAYVVAIGIDVGANENSRALRFFAEWWRIIWQFFLSLHLWL